LLLQYVIIEFRYVFTATVPYGKRNNRDIRAELNKDENINTLSILTPTLSQYFI